MRVLITGAGGFVGGHLIHHLKQTMPDAELHGTTLFEHDLGRYEGTTFHVIDLKDRGHVVELLNQTQPDHVYHLAAQAFVPRSFEDPWETLENNILSQLNIIESYLELGIKPRTLVISSSEIYGNVTEDQLPVTEETPFKPTNPYSVSKVTQDMLAYQYHLSHGLPLMRTRAFNHFGPGQSERFVAPAFAMQVARIEAGLQEPTIKVGNLSAARDFTDVRDIVRAYGLVMNSGEPGQVYNIASGQAYTAQKILDILVGLSNVSVTIEVDPARLRPVEVPVVIGSRDRLEQHTGWRPEIPFEQSVSDILADCRQRVVNQQGA